MRADIADERSPQREKSSSAVKRKLCADEEIAPLVVAEKGFLTFARPLDRTANASRRPGDEGELGIERIAGAEIAADVAGHHPNAIGRDAENTRELVLLPDDAAAAGVERGAAARRVIAADGGARLERHAGDALDPGVEFHHMCRVRERGRGRGGVANLGIDADVRGSFVPELRGVRPGRCDRVGHRGKRLEVDAHAFGGILRLADAFRDHHGDGLAGKAGLVVGKHAVG